MSAPPVENVVKEINGNEKRRVDGNKPLRFLRDRVCCMRKINGVTVSTITVSRRLTLQKDLPD